MTWHARVLGVGDAFSELYFPTSFLLQCDGFSLGVDCPDRYRAVLAQLRQHTGRQDRLEDIDDFVITHVHGDHMNGLEGVAFYKHFAQGRRLRLHAAAEVHEVIWEQRLQGSMGQLWDGRQLKQMHSADYFDSQVLTAASANHVGPFTIHIHPTRHHVPTSALRIEAHGATLGYSSDTAFDPELIEFLESADIIIHETNLGPSHTELHQLMQLPSAVRDKLRLVHYPDAFDGEASEIQALREGDVLVLGT